MGREYDGILDRLESKEADVFLRGSAADVLFECARCGQCCLGGAYTTVDDQDINRIAAGMGLEPEDIREAFTTSDPENIILLVWLSFTINILFPLSGDMSGPGSS